MIMDAASSAPLTHPNPRSLQAGYREGLEEGKEVTLQQGFNAGEVLGHLKCTCAARTALSACMRAYRVWWSQAAVVTPQQCGSTGRSTSLCRMWTACGPKHKSKQHLLQHTATLLPVGFAEGAQAGYDFGLVKGALQVLAAHLQDGQKRAKVGGGAAPARGHSMPCLSCYSPMQL